MGRTCVRVLRFTRLALGSRFPTTLCGALLGLLLATGDAPAEPAEATAVSGAAEPRTAAAVYGEMVRPTPWLSPDDEQRSFHLPPDFEIRLFASEPQIAKPLNMAIDVAGRLWLTQTTAYPTPAPAGSPTDAVVVLEDTDGDGSADRVTTFADGLNIPIGVLPYGEGCICFSIPNIYYLRDTDGDGVCDRRDVILGPFDTSRDTHGMVNSLREGGDGWIYACHGFNNRSTVAGTDGHAVYLESGNTFRFRPDGSRIEQVTQGQVNPFGMTRDEWGYWYSADCHSKPITQLVRGGCYPSFGRPHDGLGFLPPTVDHLHGSTAISGVLYIPSDSPLVPLRRQMLSGNVMTSRLNRNLLTYQGATARGHELPDFLTSDDPWFRPVDLQIDQQHHIYVADFYNKIIGHYEVPLDHPDRDRTSGRIWQIRYRPAANVGNPQLTPAAAPVDQPAVQDPATLNARLRSSAERERVRLLAAASELQAWPAPLRQTVLACLEADSPHVVRAAAEAIGRVDTDEADVWVLAQRLQDGRHDDPVLRQTLRIAIRNRLNRASADAPLWNELISERSAAVNADELASILIAVPREQVVEPILRYLRANPQSPQRGELIRHIAAHAGATTLDRVVQRARELAGESLVEQHEMLTALHRSPGRKTLEAQAVDPLRQWAVQLAQHVLSRLAPASRNQDKVLAWSTSDGEPWADQQRQTEGGSAMLLRSSHTRGESYVGALVSDPFPAPKVIRFRLAGHAGTPPGPAHERNFVRLVRVADGAVLRQAFPPRNDVAQLIEWELADLAGQVVRIECHDGDAENAYAWLAIGGFDPPWLDESALLAELRTALQWVRQMQLHELSEPLEQLATADRYSPTIRLEAAISLAQVEQARHWEAVLAGFQLSPLLAASADAAIEQFLAARSASEPEIAAAALDEACQRLTSHLSAQEELLFVRSWTQRGAAPERLLRMCELGWVSRAVLLDEELSSILRTQMNEAAQQRWQKLTAGLEPLDREQHQQQLELIAQIESLLGDRAAGGEVFKRHCAACHQLRGAGSVIGPQLDGAVARSTTRLIEDILSPDRNVDEAFRTTSLLLDDGRVVVGMVQSENESAISLADAAGKAIVVESAAVQTRVESGRSLMPGNFMEVLSAADLADLLAYLREP